MGTRKCCCFSTGKRENPKSPLFAECEPVHYLLPHLPSPPPPPQRTKVDLDLGSLARSSERHPRSQRHAAQPLDDLRRALALGLVLDELLGDEQLRPGVGVVVVEGLLWPVGELGHAGAEMSGDRHRVQHVAVLELVEDVAALVEGGVDLLGRAGLVVAQGHEVAQVPPELGLVELLRREVLGVA